MFETLHMLCLCRINAECRDRTTDYIWNACMVYIIRRDFEHGTWIIISDDSCDSQGGCAII